MKKVKFAGISIIMCIISISMAHAKSLELYTFTGTVGYSDFESKSHSDFASGLNIVTGDTFAGHLSFIYDPLLPPQDSNNKIYYPLYSFKIMFDDFIVNKNWDTGLFTYIYNSTDFDNISFWDDNAKGSTKDYIEDVNIDFFSSTGAALDGTGLPATIMSKELDAGDLYILFGDGSSFTAINGSFDTLHTYSLPPPVPEPSTMLLVVFGTAMSCLIWWRPRKKK